MAKENAAYQIAFAAYRGKKEEYDKVSFAGFRRVCYICILGSE
jgi:hypothetical protein